jgi:hypothetical protein
MVEVKFSYYVGGNDGGIEIPLDYIENVDGYVEQFRNLIFSSDNYKLSIGDDFLISGKITDTVAYRKASANMFEITFRTLCESL